MDLTNGLPPGIATTLTSNGQNQQGTGTINSNNVVSKQTKNKKEKLEIYHDIDRAYFSSDKPQNPMAFIDKDRQKVMINPGVSYKSTSEKEIFERRLILHRKEYYNKINPFIAAPRDTEEEGIYEGKEEETYIQANWEAYQLKTIYKHQVKEEIEWDSDDEDALILAQQPYETVMSTGFGDYLNHLDTKLLARRSDIIVSSTLSITLTPVDDDGYKPSQFAKVTPKQIWEYSMLRQEYRAFFVVSNKITRDIVHRRQEMTESSISKIDINNDVSHLDSMFDEDQNNADDKSEDNHLPVKAPEAQIGFFKLPKTLLTKELHAK